MTTAIQRSKPGTRMESARNQPVSMSLAQYSHRRAESSTKQVEPESEASLLQCDLGYGARFFQFFFDNGQLFTAHRFGLC
jgi:hypothetical protein